MQLTTPVHIEPLPFKIGYQQPTLVIGSCFAANIGERLERFKFPVLVNPFGVVYNPVSVANSVEFLLGTKGLNESDVFYNNDLWSSFYHHSSFSSSSKEELLRRIKQELKNGSTFLQNATRVIITLGTARVYEYKQTKQVVSSCHKLPSAEFTHRLLSVDEVYHSLASMLDSLRALNPQLKALFTVSPIRHVKDGVHGNQLSKATLLLAVDRLCSESDNAAYFPAYELMMDELRDYRYYAEDMLHPSVVAVSYIWDKFCATAFDGEALELMPELKKILDAKAHRPFNPDGDKYKVFKATFLNKTKSLKKRYPFLNLAEEICFFDEI